MAKKKKPAKAGAPKFNHNPFSHLKGFAVPSTSVNNPQKTPPSEDKSSAEDPASFDEEMQLLGVQRLNSGDPEADEEILVSQPPVLERKLSAPPQSDEELFLQSVGEMEVRFNDQLPEPSEPSTASPRRMKQLRQGRLIPDASLDLHGIQRAEVADKIRYFLQDAVYQGWQTLLIITGKGLHSTQGEPVLRMEAERFLTDEGGKYVVEWGRAPLKYGGSGALVLFLRKNRT